MTQRKRAFLLVAGLASAAVTMTGCELLVSFDRSLIDAGVEADAASADTGPATDAPTDTTVPTDAGDAGDATAPEASVDASDAGDAAHDAGDAGCTSSSECSFGQACDKGTGVCTTTCSSTQTCNGVCCNGTTCEPGDAAAACGVGGGMCANCTTADGGGECINGACGCGTSSDCPVGLACNSALHQCESSCGSTQLCHGTCCSGGTCATEGPTSCGLAGGSCSNCVTADAGAVCVDLPDASAGGACGCTQTSDCPLNFACDVATHTCTIVCDTAQACHGGCCSATSGGTCQVGTAGPECGSTGGLCAVCTGNASGTACVGSGVCGCATTADCACGTSGTDAGACACGGSPGACADTEITAFSAAVTGGVPSSTTLTVATTNATSCTVNGTTSPCNGSVAEAPSGTTTYTLVATGPGGSTSTTVTVFCAPVSDPSLTDGGTCPSGVTVFCETVAISTTSSSQAMDACGACAGAACTNDPSDATNLGLASAARSPDGVYYVYQAGTTQPVAGNSCSNALTYIPAAGDEYVSGATTCPAGDW